MNDRELLELAAKAAGINYDSKHDSKYGLWLVIDHEPHEYTRRRWNPLTDDGDALRLAVKLDMQIWRNTGNTVSGMPPSAGFWNRDEVDLAPDPYAATRRAIVRAAAEIGKELK